MFNRSKILKVTTLWVGLLTASVLADDVSVKNKLGQTAKFSVLIPSTGFDKTISVKPGETVNPIGTDLWHNAEMAIYAYSPDSSVICAVTLIEKPLFREFYLPYVSPLGKHPLCKYTNGFPCKCFHSSECAHLCVKELSNAQVIISNTAANADGHPEL